jgi:hypothetical protein
MSISNGSANQVPTPSSTSVTPPLVVTCANVFKTDAGPPIGNYLPATILEDDIDDDRQDLYRSGEKIGTAREFVEFDNGQKIILEVAVYLRKMIDDAASDGVVIWTSSGFRTMAQQAALVEEKGLASQGGLAAAAGWSNHQNGIAVDFDVVRDNGKPFEWLTMNAWKYGFIRAVTKERWHWEYWGNWTGQEKPDWALNWHSPKTMFSIVSRVHACGDGTSGKYPMKAGNWWSTYYSSLSNHSDYLTGGKTNSWIGYGNTHLPDKFDMLYSGWDTTVFSPFLNGAATGVGDISNVVGIFAMPPQS